MGFCFEWPYYSYKFLLKPHFREELGVVRFGRDRVCSRLLPAVRFPKQFRTQQRRRRLKLFNVLNSLQEEEKLQNICAITSHDFILGFLNL